ncbi:hypothetical protein M569_08073, partial [Genlisea aurea]
SMATKIEASVEMKSDADKVWESIKESTTLFPKALPRQYASIDLLQGDGKSVDSVRLIKFHHGTTKEKIVGFDEEGKTIVFAVTEGNLLKYADNVKATVSVTGSDGCSVKWCMEFDKMSEEAPDPELMKGFAVECFQDLDAY